MPETSPESFLDSANRLLAISKSQWPGQETLATVIDSVKASFPKDFDNIKKDMAYIFEKQDDIAWQTEKTIALLEKWKSSKKATSALSIIAFAVEQFGIKDPEALYRSAILAEIPCELDYHNNLHFRKVVLHMIRMIAAHNFTAEATNQELSEDQISLLLAGACIHDIGHCGTGNIIDRKYHMAMTEERSFYYAEPYLRDIGFTQEMLRDLKIIILTTDVSPFGDPVSPANQARRAYEYHFGHNIEADSELDLSDTLRSLEERDDLTLMCIMLHEADIMNSAAVDYDITLEESIAISDEIGREQTLPEDTLLFLEIICAKEMVSDAAKYLGEDNFSKITDRVMEDYRSGNRAYKKAS